ncbi:MAG: DUF1501 domain-containing protein, partial [Planctomycetaceae bacterium]
MSANPEPSSAVNSLSRRSFLRDCGAGFGTLALASLAAGKPARASDSNNALAPRSPHFEARAKRVILLWMQGGPSQMDLFDYKPRLEREAGEKIPFSLSKDNDRFDDKARLFGPAAKFQQFGDSGMWVSDMLPHLAQKVDQLC